MPKWPKIEPKFQRIARFAPLIGALIGFSQSFTWLLLTYFNWPNTSVALISIAISILITGGLHFDGLMDTVDGISAGPSKRIKALKDSRVGAIGVQSLVIILIIQIAAIIKLDFYATFAFPLAAFWGRLSQIFAIENYEYIFKKEQISFHHQHWKGLNKEIRPSIIILTISILIFLFSTNSNTFNTFLLINCLISGVTTSMLIPKLINNLLGGHCGDSYGASLVITETANLFILSLILAPN